MKTITISSASGYKYNGPHTFKTPEKALAYLREKFNDGEMEYATDPNEEGAASVEIITKLCGNHKLVATALIG